MPDPFDVLGVASDSSSDEITIAYRRLVERHHPDRLSGASREQRAAAHDRMAEINAVYRMLTDPVELARWRHLSRGDSPPATEDGVRFSVADDRRYRGMDWAEPDPDFDHRRRAPAEFTVGVTRKAVDGGRTSWHAKTSSVASHVTQTGMNVLITTRR